MKSAEVTRYTGTAYDGEAGSRMERAGVVWMPRCCHSVIREPGNGMFDAYLYTDVSAGGIGVMWKVQWYEIRKRPR